MKINRNVICEKCHGSGSNKGSSVDSKCKKCNGSGREMKTIRQGNTIYQTQGVCSTCEGRKFDIADADKCEGCQGKKVVKEPKIITLDIEPGMQVNQQMSFYGEADQFPDTITGDVVFTLAPVSPEPSIFERRGNDLFCKQEIDLSEALYGAKILLKHLDDRQLLISTPNGAIIQPGEKKRIVGQGMPMLNKPERFGDLYIEFTVNLPKSLTKQQKSDLQKIIPPKTLQYDDNKVVKCEMNEVTLQDERKRERHYQEESRQNGGGPHVQQCTQQ
jgi:DnaJ family protein A protein 2